MPKRAGRPSQSFSFEYMKMRVDFGRAMLAQGQGDGFVARGQGWVGSSSGSDIRLPASPGPRPRQLRNPAAAPAAVRERTNPELKNWD